MKCEKCGMELNEGYSFCPNCGNKSNMQTYDSNTNDSINNLDINNSTNDSYVNPFTQGYGLQDDDMQYHKTDNTNNAKNETLHENIGAFDNNFDKKENKQEIKANMNGANYGQSGENIILKIISSKKVLLLTILAIIVIIVSLAFLVIHFTTKHTNTIEDSNTTSSTPDNRYSSNIPTSTLDNKYNLNTPTSTDNNVNNLSTPFKTANSIYNSSTPTGSFNSANIVELSGHKLKIPNGLIIDSELDSNATMLHDSEGKFYATIAVEEYNYQVLREYPGLYKMSLMQATIDTDAEISDGVKEVIDGKEFIIYETTIGNSKLLVAISELDSNEIMIVSISSVNNDFNNDYLKRFALITEQ